MDHLRGIYRIYPNLIKETRRMRTCNRLDLPTLESQLIMPQNVPDHQGGALLGENRRLVTDEPVEFEKSPVEVGDLRRITNHFGGIYIEYTSNERKQI